MISLFFITFSLINFGQAGIPCTFDFVKDTATTNRPVYLKRTVTGPRFRGIVAVGSEVLYLAGKDKTIQLESYNPHGIYSNLVLVCPGDGTTNYSNKPRSEEVELVCNSDGSFSCNGEKVTVKDLACDEPATLKFMFLSLQEGKHLCDKFKESIAVHLVYQLTPDDYPRKLVPRVCLNRTTMQPLFTFHRIQKEHLSPAPTGEKENSVQKTRKWRVEPFVKHLMVPEQELIRFPGIDVNKTDLYGLTVPMFPSISRNNMAKVEHFIRSKARENEDQFTEVFTVSIDLEGVEKLYVTKNKNAGRWLPLIVAKIIKTKEFCLGLLVVNRLERVSKAESICKSECKKHSLKFDENPSSGRVHCCPYSSISGYIPEDLQSTYLKQCNS